MWFRPHSIRQKLTLWYVGVLAAVLLVFAGVLYASMAVSLKRDIDRALMLEVDGLAGTVAAFREAEKTAEAETSNWLSSPPLTLAGLEHRGQLPDLLNRWSKSTASMETQRVIRLMDRRGQTLLASQGFLDAGETLSGNPAVQTPGIRPIYQTLRAGDKRMRFVSYPIYTGSGRILYIVQLAESLDQLDNSLWELRLWLAWLIPLMLALASVGGWFLASRALRPVDRMIMQARQIGGGGLEKRIHVPEADDELSRLAQTFNEMLGRMEQTFRRLRQFSAAASHELRTPLTVMKGELEVALRKPRTEEEYQRVLRAHLGAIQDMSNIVGELLTLSRAEAAEEAVDWKHVDIGRLVREEGETWEKIARKKRIRVQVQGDSPLGVWGESQLLQRLVSNLLDNAVKHTPAGGVIAVQMERRSDQARLVVHDTGPGIAPEKLPGIFDRFFSRRPIDGESGSVGLGLGLCRWIAEAHRGRIEAASAPGQGATFTVWLPLYTS